MKAFILLCIIILMLIVSHPKTSETQEGEAHSLLLSTPPDEGEMDKQTRNPETVITTASSPREAALQRKRKQKQLSG